MSTFETVLKKYLDIFLSEEMYFVNDQRNLEFFKKNPANDTAENIRMKLSAMQDMELSSNTVTEDMINHILKLNIDSRIQHGDLSVVNDIAHLQAKGKSFTLLHFASAYCNLHRPDVFPIYSDQYHDFYKRYIHEHKLNLNPDNITSYDTFSKALNDLIERWELKGKLNYLNVRKFAWLYAERIVNESKQ